MVSVLNDAKMNGKWKLIGDTGSTNVCEICGKEYTPEYEKCLVLRKWNFVNNDPYILMTMCNDCYLTSKQYKFCDTTLLTEEEWLTYKLMLK